MSHARFWVLPLAAAGCAFGATALAADGCAAPGRLVLEDAAGDAGVAPVGAAPVAVDDPVGRVPVPEPSFDFLSLHMADGGGKLVFTFQVASLESPQPNVGYSVRLSTEVPPANGANDYFVAMFDTVDGGQSFVYGTTGPHPEAGTGPRLFNIAGPLDASSNYQADGTITLVLNTGSIPGAEAGLAAFEIIPTVRIMTPTQDATGFTTNGNNGTILDDALPETGYYEFGAACDDKSGLAAVFAGALSLLTLLPLVFAGALRRR